MSCGKPHETDCSDVIEAVYLYLDGEIDEQNCALIREHLDECGPCLAEYGIEQEVKDIVARSCGCDEVPTNLRSRVLARITEVRVEVSQTQLRAE